jgi:hypothetical protein
MTCGERCHKHDWRGMGTMTPHPQRCETCERRHDNHNCFYLGIRLSESDRDFIEIIGCASHSSIPSEQEIREKVLEEVRSACINDESAGYPIFRILQELRSKQGEQK